jgi:hypothetical protein
METIKIDIKLSNEEKETVLTYDNVEKRWIMDSTVLKHYNKALKQGWKPIRKYVYDDNTVCGMVLVAPERSITIRNIEAKKMSDKQLKNLR